MAFDLVGKAVKKLRLPTVNYDNSPIKIIPAQCGDINSRFFSVEMYDDRGDIDLSKYTTVMLNATLPDGTLQIQTGEIDQTTKTVTCKIAGSMISQSGKITCDIALQGVDSNGDGIRLTSQTFYIFAANSQSDDSAIEGDDDYGLLTQLLNEVSQVEAEIKTAEQGRVTAETQRVNEFSAAKKDCETATEKANDIYDTITETLDALPCSTEVVDGSTTSGIVTLRFIKLGG